MMRRTWILAFAAFAGCTCKRPGGSEPGASASVSAAPSASVIQAQAAARGPFRHSLPLAATVSREGVVVAAALAVKDKSVDLLTFSPTEPKVAAAMVPAAWKSDAELRFFGHEGTAQVLLFRGEVDGQVGRFATWLDAAGAVAKKPAMVGAGACLAGASLYWVDAQGQLRSRGPDGEQKSLRLPAVDDPQWSLVCGTADVWLSSDGDDGLSVTKVTGAKSHGKLEAAFAATDLDPDNTREVHALADGDHVAFVGLGSAGKVLWRPRREAVPRVLQSTLGEGDDVVALDAHDGGLLAVFTREAQTDAGDRGEVCQAVSAVVVGKDRERVISLASAGCGRTRGPFFVSALGDGRRMVSWVERRSNKGLGLPAVAGLGYAVVAGDTDAASGGFLTFESDGLVDAGCFRGRCAAVGLIRPAGATDDAQPGAVEVRWYP